jgi:hypothetical protein
MLPQRTRNFVSIPSYVKASYQLTLLYIARAVIPFSRLRSIRCSTSPALERVLPWCWRANVVLLTPKFLATLPYEKYAPGSRESIAVFQIEWVHGGGVIACCSKVVVVVITLGWLIGRSRSSAARSRSYLPVPVGCPCTLCLESAYARSLLGKSATTLLSPRPHQNIGFVLNARPPRNQKRSRRLYPNERDVSIGPDVEHK